MKKVVFFDGDGTLWYPRSSQRQRPPHWVYNDDSISDPIKECIVTPNTVTTLVELGVRGIKRVLLSSSPLPEEEAIMHRIKLTQHVEIHDLLDDIRAAPDYKHGKAEQLVRLLGEYSLQPQDALMVGDTYHWDYVAAQKVGVDAILIDSDYRCVHADNIAETRVMSDISGVIDFL